MLRQSAPSWEAGVVVLMAFSLLIISANHPGCCSGHEVVVALQALVISGFCRPGVTFDDY